MSTNPNKISFTTGLLIVATCVATYQAYVWRRTAIERTGEITALRQKLRQEWENTRRLANSASTASSATSPAEHAEVKLADNSVKAGAKLKSALAAIEGTSVGIKGTFIRSNGKIGSGFKSLFELSPSESDSLQGALDKGAEAMARLAQANAVVVLDTENDLIIDVPTFAAEGTQIYSDILDTFASTLGSERQLAFIKIAGEQLDRSFNQFGAESLKFTVTRTNADPKHPYEVRVDAKGPSSTGYNIYPVSDLKSFVTDFGPAAQVLSQYIKKAPAPPK